MSFLKTNNPAFAPYFWEQKNVSQKKMTVSGIIIKTFLMLFITTGITVFVWKLYSNGVNIKWFATGGVLAAIVISIVLSVRQNWAHILVPLYAIAKGFFLGGFTSYIKAQYPEMPYQAVGVTLVTFFTILMLYQTRIIVVTKKLRSVIITVCSTIFLVYLISWILSFFGIRSFIWGTSWLAISFNIVAATFAALSFLLDFDFIERYKNKAPKYKEWMACYGLLVTIIWLYVEVLRLMKKLAIKF
ncbi:MAG: Bax inhibitor-1/YccA family protein [Lacinutrix venerupis]